MFNVVSPLSNCLSLGHPFPSQTVCNNSPNPDSELRPWDGEVFWACWHNKELIPSTFLSATQFPASLVNLTLL